MHASESWIVLVIPFVRLLLDSDRAWQSWLYANNKAISSSESSYWLRQRQRRFQWQRRRQPKCWNPWRCDWWPHFILSIFVIVDVDVAAFNISTIGWIHSKRSKFRHIHHLWISTLKITHNFLSCDINSIPWHSILSRTHKHIVSGMVEMEKEQFRCLRLCTRLVAEWKQ